jgi:hypothetical protein
MIFIKILSPSARKITANYLLLQTVAGTNYQSFYLLHAY